MNFQNVIFLSKTLIDLFISTDDQKMNFIINWALKRRWVSINYKEYSPMVKKNVLWTLQKCVIREITFDSKNFFPAFCLGPLAKTSTSLNYFALTLQPLYNFSNKNLVCLANVVGFNAKCSKWKQEDKKNTVGLENYTLEKKTLTQVMMLKSLINNSSLCLDLIFFTNKNMLDESGV